MAIPDFQSIMRPLLEAHADGHEHRNRDLVAQLADAFALTDEERREGLRMGALTAHSTRFGE
jgi:restriction system protein